MNRSSTSPEALLEASGLAGRATARPGGASDAIEGVIPRFVVEPDSPEALATLLAWSSKERVSVVLRGNGTKLGWGRRLSEVDLIVSTRRLSRVLAHQHGDLTATIEAGATIGHVGRELARHGQWLPLGPSFPDATIGGIVATNDSGPLRHRYGTPRDLLIGIRLALADGRLVKAGGNVVKNVAGYDLGKLMSGSFGSLAAIVSATFKLAPLPASSSTLVAAFRDQAALARAVGAIGSSQLEPAAFDLHVLAGSGPDADVAQAFRPAWFDGLTPRAGRGANAGLKPRATAVTLPHRLLIQFASTPNAVEAQIDQARGLMADGELDVVSGTTEADLWQAHGQRIWGASGAVIRLSWLPAAAPAVLALVDGIRRLGVTSVELVGRAGVGAGLIRVDADAPTQVASIEHLRSKPDLVGNVVVLRADAGVKEGVDIWGPPGDTAKLLNAIKHALDPTGILNPGRGPI